LYLKTSHDYGSSFGNIVELGVKPGFSEPLVSASDENLYIAWVDQTFNQSQLKLKASNDSGITFYPHLYSINGVTVGSNPQILSSDNNLYVSWVNSSGIFFQASVDSGKNFDNPQRAIKSSELQVALNPAHAAQSNIVYTAWQQISPLPDGRIGIGIYFIGGNITKGARGSESNPFAELFSSSK
jgi:hypothetical protein